MDEGLGGKVAMVEFLNLVMSEPDIAELPIAIGAHKWDIIEAGKMCSGRCVVNSISFERRCVESFVHQAKLVKR